MLKKLFNSNKAITTTVFAWIFMSIIGGIFIMTTYSLLTSYWEFEDENNRIEFSKALTNHLSVEATGIIVQSATTFRTYPLLANKKASLECIGGEFSRLRLDDEELGYGSLNEYLDEYPIVMPPLEEELEQNLYLVKENFNFPMGITPLIGIIPTRHIVVINETSNIKKVIEKLLDEKRSYRQLSFELWNTSDISEDEMSSYLQDLNPSSIALIGFNTSFTHNFIQDKFSSSTFPVFNIKTTFNKLPSYIDSSNEERIVLGNLKYTFSNLEIDHEITNQENSVPPKEFNFYGINDEFSILLFSYFSTPSNFECTYSSIISQTEFVYEHTKKKIDIILNEPEDLNSTYCDSSKQNSILENYYGPANTTLFDMFTSTSQNFLTTNSGDISTHIVSLEEKNSELRAESCQLIY